MTKKTLPSPIDVCVIDFTTHLPRFALLGQFSVEEMPLGDAEIFLCDEKLPQFAVFVVLATHKRDKPPVLAFPEEIGEEFVGFLSAPVLYASKLRYVDKVKIHWFAEIE